MAKTIFEVEQSDFSEPPLSIEGAASHWNHRKHSDDYYTQAVDLLRIMRSEQQKALCENTGRAMGDASEEIKNRHISNCMKADKKYGEGVATALGIPLSKIS